MTNKEVVDFVFAIIKSYGFKPYDIEYVDCSLIEDSEETSAIEFRANESEEYSTVRFRVNGISKYWKIHMWIRSEYLDEKKRKEKLSKCPLTDKDLDVIYIWADCDYDEKFDFRHKNLKIEKHYSEWDQVVESKTIIELENMLNMLKQHPIRYTMQSNDKAEHFSGSFHKYFIEYEAYHLMNQLKKEFLKAILVPYMKNRCNKARKDKYIKELEFVNFKKANPGLAATYLYGINVKFVEKATEDEETEWLHKWFKQCYYGKLNYYDSVVELLPLTKEGREVRYSYYY